jgi:hypothetical protein
MVASLLSGLLWDARTQTAYRIGGALCRRKGGGPHRRILQTAAAQEGRARYLSFPYEEAFEPAFLALLREVPLADVVGDEPSGEASALHDERKGVEARIDRIKGQLTGGDDDIPAIVESLRALNTRREDLLRRETAARQREANPRAVAWQEARSLLDVVLDGPRRLKLRSLLHSLLESVWLLVVPRGRDKLAIVQAFFASGGRRDYLILHRAAGFCRPGGWCARSMLAPETQTAAGAPLDLRQPRGAERFRRLLESLDLTAAFPAPDSR